MRRLKKN